MARIAVTGGSGKLGRAARGARHRQRRHGHEHPTADLVTQHLPRVEVRGDLEGFTTLLSIDRARRVLGYEPQHSWRDEPAG